MPRMRIEGRTFLVTGGGSGLGGATVRMLAAQGANVIIADINAEAGQRVASELGDLVQFAKTDVASAESVESTVSLATKTFGGLHGVINAAGIAVAEKVLGKNGPHPLDLFTKILTVNLIGTFNTIRLAV